MSRQTSLQRADQKSPECHHLFRVVKIHPKSEAGTARISNRKKSALQRRPSRHAKNKSQKTRLTKAGTLTRFPDPFSFQTLEKTDKVPHRTAREGDER
jgi:hypothetical protein